MNRLDNLKAFLKGKNSEFPEELTEDIEGATDFQEIWDAFENAQESTDVIDEWFEQPY